jgi:hypothetical protein
MDVVEEVKKRPGVLLPISLMLFVALFYAAVDNISDTSTGFLVIFFVAAALFDISVIHDWNVDLGKGTINESVVMPNAKFHFDLNGIQRARNCQNMHLRFR